WLCLRGFEDRAGRRGDRRTGECVPPSRRAGAHLRRKPRLLHAIPAEHHPITPAMKQTKSAIQRTVTEAPACAATHDARRALHGLAPPAARARLIASLAGAPVASSTRSSRRSRAPRATAASASSKQAALAPPCSSSRRSRR